MRVVQQKTFRRIGGEKDITVDVRIISATNQNLKEKVARGAFREDLYFRLNVIPVSYTHLRAHETVLDLVCRLLLEKKKKNNYKVDS